VSRKSACSYRGAFAGARLLSLLLWGLVAPAAICAVDVRSVKVHELKAAYIYNFTKFTSWPATSFADEKAPLVIGVLGNESFAKTLRDLVNGHAVNGHAVEVRDLLPSQSLQGLHVLYVDVSVEAQLGTAEDLFASPGMLTVGESEQFTARGGVIRFVVDGARLQFEINVSAAQRAGLVLSSQLLMLAKAVRKSP
jgi:hypothetical protein